MTMRRSIEYIDIFRVFFALSLAIFILPHIVTPCWGYSKEQESATISLNAENLPLGKICDQINKKTGYNILFDERYIKETITIKLENVTLSDGVKRIMQKLGIKSYAIVTDEVNHALEIYTYGNDFSGRVATINGRGEAVVTPPSNSGLPGLTLAELKAIQAENYQNSKNVPPNMIVTPPSSSGEPGLTRDELEAILESNQRKQMNRPKDMVVTPPSSSGEPGLTRSQLEAILENNKQRQTNLPKDTVVTPPSPSGEPGLTRAQLEALLESNKKKMGHPNSKETVPPAFNGQSGKTNER